MSYTISRPTWLESEIDQCMKYVKSSLLRCVILIRTLRCLAPASVYARWVELSWVESCLLDVMAKPLACTHQVKKKFDWSGASRNASAIPELLAVGIKSKIHIAYYICTGMNESQDHCTRSRPRPGYVVRTGNATELIRRSCMRWCIATVLSVRAIFLRGRLNV